MEHSILLQKAVLVAAAGITAQWVAWKIRIPSIVLLSVAGILMGPIAGWLNPAEDFGHLADVLIKLAVAVILFEGGLNLRFFELKQAGKAVRRLVLISLPLAWILGTALAHKVVKLSLPVSLILGAILVVTGPTVIMPLIRQTKLSSRMASLLKWEGIVNDPIGALLAVLVFEYFISSETHSASTTILQGLFLSVLVSAALGIGGGYFLRFAFHRGHIPDFLKIPVVLSLVGLVYALANLVQEEAGLLAVTLLGMTLGNIGLMMIDELRQFKEYITIFLVSAVFIILSASLQPIHWQSVSWRTAAFLVGLLFFVRPASILASTIGSGLAWNERILLGWIAPRGIVAASVAGLFAPRLVEQGFSDATFLVPIVFAVVFTTVILHGFSLPILARRLGLSTSRQGGIMIVGASSWSTGLAWVIQQTGVHVLLVDSSWQRLREARLQGIPIHYGEILSENTEEALDLSEIAYILATTDNDAYNALVCNTFASHFERDRTFQISMHRDLQHETKKIKTTTRGQTAFGEDYHYETLLGRYFQGWRFQKTSITQEFGLEQLKSQRKNDVEPMILLRESGKIDFSGPDQPLNPKPGDTLIHFGIPMDESVNGGRA